MAAVLLPQGKLAGGSKEFHAQPIPLSWHASLCFLCFCPQDFEVREGSTEYGPFYQFFDVEVQPLQVGCYGQQHKEAYATMPCAWLQRSQAAGSA